MSNLAHPRGGHPRQVSGRMPGGELGILFRLCPGRFGERKFHESTAPEFAGSPTAERVGLSRRYMGELEKSLRRARGFRRCERFQRIQRNFRLSPTRGVCSAPMKFRFAVRLGSALLAGQPVFSRRARDSTRSPLAASGNADRWVRQRNPRATPGPSKRRPSPPSPGHPLPPAQGTEVL